MSIVGGPSMESGLWAAARLLDVAQGPQLLDELGFF
jgi:hypothetical protein